MNTYQQIFDTPVITHPTENHTRIADILDHSFMINDNGNNRTESFSQILKQYVINKMMNEGTNSIKNEIFDHMCDNIFIQEDIDKTDDSMIEAKLTIGDKQFNIHSAEDLNNTIKSSMINSKSFIFEYDQPNANSTLFEITKQLLSPSNKNINTFSNSHNADKLLKHLSYEQLQALSQGTNNNSIKNILNHYTKQPDTIYETYIDDDHNVEGLSVEVKTTNKFHIINEFKCNGCDTEKLFNYLFTDIEDSLNDNLGNDWY